MGGVGQGVFGLITARTLWIPVAIAVLIQGLLFFTFPPEIAFDSTSYMVQAESLAANGKALNAAGEPDTVRTPGYPLFLATFLVTHLGFPGAILAQRLLWLVVVVATTLLCFRMTKSTIASVIAGVITAVDLPALQATNSILTETLAAVVVCASVWQVHRSAPSRNMSGLVLAGVLASVAALIRPVAILLGVPLALAVIIAGSRQMRLRAASAIVVASLVVSATWVARNYFETGVATFSSISNINLLLYRAAGTLAIRDPGGMDANIQRRQRELEAAACRAVVARFGRECSTVPIAVRATLYDDLAMPIIFSDPAGTGMQAARAFTMIMFGGGASMLSGITGMPESMTRLLALGYTVPLALLAGIGAVYWWRIDRLAAALMLLTIAYLVVMSLGVEAYSRFRVPFLPLYAMLAGGGAAALADRWIRSHPNTN